MVFGFWHILLTCAPFAGGLSNALAVFTRRGPTPRAHSLKIWWSCAHSFKGSPLACLSFPLKLRGAAGEQGDVHTGWSRDSPWSLVPLETN